MASTLNPSMMKSRIEIYQGLLCIYSGGSEYWKCNYRKHHKILCPVFKNGNGIWIPVWVSNGTIQKPYHFWKDTISPFEYQITVGIQNMDFKRVGLRMVGILNGILNPDKWLPSCHKCSSQRRVLFRVQQHTTFYI